MKQYIAIFIGGALGALLRFEMNVHIRSGAFPAATLIENAAGSLLLGLITGYFIIRAKRPLLSAFLGTGFCGGFTTMSTFSKETVFLMQSSPQDAFLYFAVTMVSGLALAFAGIAAGRQLAFRIAGRGHKTS
ncbi:CrcB family protein [Bacillus sp. ISL-51]|uniref:fluoride efflux transporter FluC n=1 Tax=Bacteria TaxID=2 RepID=UPI001BE66908|nr:MULTISPECIES: CrcB family protein [Bacteria]MBT2573988.1 CrcB family protein [Bacillus sp. ISL-51]MBT2634681.1 CrcB family protein [Bacillus sp. ISL-26]MBT2712157.1 CrcB family protein [Pseudomonas sp. ISL-88]